MASNTIEDVDDEPSQASTQESSEVQSPDKKKRIFSKELRCMMYGFGDDHNPYTESVDMLEDLVIQFISEVALRAMDIGRSGRVSVEDVMHLVQRDGRKFARVRDLLTMNEELKKARKAFDEVKYVQSAWPTGALRYSLYLLYRLFATPLFTHYNHFIYNLLINKSLFL